jgi:hypothetical protein
VIHFLWLKSLTAFEISREVDEVYGQAALSLRTVERWLARFAAAEEGLEDFPRSGRPRSDENIAITAHLLTDDSFPVYTFAIWHGTRASKNWKSLIEN